MSAKKTTDATKKAETVKAADSAVKETTAAPVEEAAVKEEKASAKKAAAPKKAAAKTTAKTTKTARTAKAAPSQNVYIQFAGKEVKAEDLVEQVKAAWVAEGHRVSSIKSLDLYVKPEDMAAYYVLNNKVEGKIEL